MNNEVFGITFQYAVCQKFNLINKISRNRINDDLLEKFINSKVIDRIFSNNPPIESLLGSKKYTSEFISRCPHSFLLKDDTTFSIKTFKKSGRMFAPKVVGQPGEKTFNYFFGHLSSKTITKNSFKEFCLLKIDKMLPIIVDYALISDVNCYLYNDNNNFNYEIIKREEKPDITYNLDDFSFTRGSVNDWNESNTVKYKGKSIIELQLHSNRSGFKIRINYKNFTELLNTELTINNSTLGDTAENNSSLGDTAELAICNIFKLDADSRLLNNSNEILLSQFESHYNDNKKALFPLAPIKYSGTEKRQRGKSSKSGVDFYLECNNTLSLKTNKSKAYKVCPPEIGQPSPKTFDFYFKKRGWYEGDMDETKFRKLVRDRSKLVFLLKEYVMHLNECDYLLWSFFLNEKDISSKLINKDELKDITFQPNLIEYSNDFTTKSSVTIRYGQPKFSLGAFQVHSARNSLKFRFNFGNLLTLKK